MLDALPLPPTLLDNDPPSHTRYRRLVSRAFTPRMVNGLRPTIEATTDRLIDQWIDAGTVEFLEAFAVPLPVAIIAKALNVPEERKHDFKRWSDDNVASIGTKLSPQPYLSAQRGVLEMQQFFVEQFERRRVDPSDDLFTAILNSHIGGADDGSDLDRLRWPNSCGWSSSCSWLVMRPRQNSWPRRYATWHRHLTRGLRSATTRARSLEQLKRA